MPLSALDEADDIIRRFIADPARTAPEWRVLAGTGEDSLCRRIQAAWRANGDADPLLRRMLEHVRKREFGEALQFAATQAEVEEGERRRWRNAQALLLTALVASAAKKVQKEGGESLPPSAIEDLAEACRLLNGPSHSAKGENLWKERAAAADACELVRRGLVSVEGSSGRRVPLAGCSAARYWINTFWLGNEEGNPSNMLQLPTVTIHSNGYHPSVGKFTAYSRPDSRVAVLIEHPLIALLCLGASLVDSIRRAWHASVERTAVWRIDDQEVIAQDDESISGAAAVVFRALAENSKIRTNVLVVARLYEDGHTLQPVGWAREKVQAAIREFSELTVILGSGGPTSALQSDENSGLTREELGALRAAVRMRVVGNLVEAVIHAAATVGVNSGSKVGAYQLERKLSESAGNFELWEASLGVERYLLKLWHVDARQQLLMRGSWDRELRMLYRVCSLPLADELLLAISDSFVSDERFALVMRTSHREDAGQPHTLESAFVNRWTHPWLELASIRSAKGRSAIWRGLRRIAEGIRILHSQNIVHRNLSAECVFYSGALTDESLRLGGFEWSVRVGGSQGQDRPSAWATPPLASSGTTTIDTDWYGFGMLAARCFFDLESFASDSPHELNRRVMTILASDELSAVLTDHERTLIEKLIKPDRGDRFTDAAGIVDAIDRTISHLSQRAFHVTGDVDSESALYVICNAKEWHEALNLFGFRPANPLEFGAEVKVWLAERFAKRTLYRMPNNDHFWLQGDKCAMRLFMDTRTQPAGSFAFADALDAVGIPERATAFDLSAVPLDFLLSDEDRRNYPDRRNWMPYLPPPPARPHDPDEERETLVRFLRCTNQLDLLLCYAEIFPCHVEALPSTSGIERVRVTPRTRSRALPAWLRSPDHSQMIRHFEERIDSSSVDAKRVVLTTHDRIRLTSAEARQNEWFLDPSSFVHRGNGPRGTPSSLVLLRQVPSGTTRRNLPHGPMHIRRRDHFGQVELIDRRGKAIDQMKGFRYLLNALAAPRPMVTAIDRLPLDADPNRIDGNKRAVLHDILSTRPIYALQGPPGTGKTTLIAHLTRQILTEDQTAQILITAQAHGAVQRLQETLSDAFRGDPEPPLTIRLGIDDDDDPMPTGNFAVTDHELVRLSLRKQTLDILRGTKEKLESRGARSPIEVDWLAQMQQMLDAAQNQNLPAFKDLSAFEVLVRDGANIVFCTTSAGDLEEIASGDKTFDWSVVEEAGKVHGYDLALPMNVGHRWLLVGDQRQLKAYHYDDFVRALDHEPMQESVDLLNELLKQNPDVVDWEWPQQWEEMKQSKDGNWTTDAFLERAKAWLKTFDHIYKKLRSTNRDERVTEDKPADSPVGRLVNQYRMHPAIGKLVTDTYYAETLPGGSRIRRVFVENQTGTPDAPLPKVLHELRMPHVVRHTPILWLDVPWCKHGSPQTREQGHPSIFNRAEVEIVLEFCRQLGFESEPAAPLKVAVLSPYVAQKEELERALRREFPNGYNRGLALKEGLYGRQRHVQKRFTHTVDSFQGNEADVVIVSFARNNDFDQGKGLGFVDDASRMNVLLSRAQRLLVMVGSWDFFQFQVGDIRLPAEQRHKRAHVKRMLSTLEDLANRPTPAFVRARLENGSFRAVTVR